MNKINYNKPLVFMICPLILIVVIVLFVGIENAVPPEYYERGIATYTKGDYGRAAQDFRQDVARNPSHSLGHYYLALSLCHEGNMQNARAEFQAAYRAEMASTHPDISFAKKCEALQNAPTCSSFTVSL